MSDYRLRQGRCCVCYYPLDQEPLHVDENGDTWDYHERCADKVDDATDAPEEPDSI